MKNNSKFFRSSGLVIEDMKVWERYKEGGERDSVFKKNSIYLFKDF